MEPSSNVLAVTQKVSKTGGWHEFSVLSLQRAQGGDGCINLEAPFLPTSASIIRLGDGDEPRNSNLSSAFKIFSASYKLVSRAAQVCKLSLPRAGAFGSEIFLALQFICFYGGHLKMKSATDVMLSSVCG